MATATSRRCGSCGQRVGTGDITCPHCDALLAAYEPPTGATIGTAAATTPVEAMSPLVSPSPAAGPPATEEPIGAGVPTTADVPAPGVAPEPIATADLSRQPSPVATALKETKAAVEATPQPASDAERRAVAAVEAQARAAQPAAPTQEPRPARPLERPTPRRPKVQTAPPAGPEVVPEAARRKGDQPPGTTEARSPARTRPGQGYGWLIVAMAVFIFMRTAGSTAFFGTLLTLGAIALVIWLVVRLTHATGRKTTRMPRDDRRRR